MLFLGFSLLVIVPVSILLILTPVIIITLRKQVLNRKHLTKQGKHDKQVLKASTLLMSVIVAFVVMATPFGVFNDHRKLKIPNAKNMIAIIMYLLRFVNRILTLKGNKTATNRSTQIHTTNHEDIILPVRKIQKDSLQPKLEIARISRPKNLMMNMLCTG
jgi:Na+/H+ antiporter NhaD/arsenite permease-like protein